MRMGNHSAVRCVVATCRGARGDRGKEEGLVETRILWNIFSATQFLSNFLEFTQCLISSIFNLLNVRG
jgi:hypothetical protein